MENKKIIKRLDEIEKRLNVLEKGTTQKSDIKIRDLSNPNELKDGQLVYAGRFKTNDGQVSSIFGSNVAKIDDIMSYDSGELANIIEAFASRERLDIIKALMEKSYTAKELLEKLNFATTGKAYHHLSHLEKIGLAAKYNDYYHISARYVGSIVLIFEGAEKIINKQSNIQ